MVNKEWLLSNGATVEFVCHPEDAPIRGNVSAIDSSTDAANERWVHAQLDQGNDWAWCTVECVAEFAGVSASDFLGCCSYESGEDFEAGAYAADMRDEALSALADKLNALARRLSTDAD